MKKEKLAKRFFALVKSQPEAEFWLQIFKAFNDCDIDSEVVQAYDFDENILRGGVALKLKAPNYNHFGFLCHEYVNLCTFIEAYAKHLKLTLPDFIVIKSLEENKKLFIFRRTRKACFSEDK